MRKFQRWFNRSYWAIRLLGLSKSTDTEFSPGLVLIQIDGLSQKQFDRALKRGCLPFLKRLLEREQYTEYAHYSGLPSSTPAVQGELFYGVKGCVPAFQFVNRSNGKIFTMYDPAAVGEIERRLSPEHMALLQGGSSYSNIFRGGASESEAHFCAASIHWTWLFKAFNPFVWPVIFIFHMNILFRTLALLVIELMLAVYDCLRGALAGQKFLMELQFVFTRVFICVLLRELVVMGAKIDIARGLPIIHLNFIGYDEQAHRRGPSSEFAHWCLRGIDDSIARIWRESWHAERRDYDFWIYSDHGQEETLSYPTEHKKRFDRVVAELFGEVVSETSKEKKFKQEHAFCSQGRIYGYLFPTSENDLDCPG